MTEIASASVHAYGEHRDQFAELTLPSGPPGEEALPVAVLIHGGFWRARYDLHLGDALVADLAGRGFAVWNLEYRRLGLLRRGGGWPETMLDVAAGIDALADANSGAALDLDRVAAIGHSAGGQLALWAAARAGMPAGAPGAESRVPLAAAVAQAGVVDLLEAERLRVGGGVVGRLLGGSAEAEPDRYALASPTARLPLGVPHLLVHGERDDTVPLSLSERHHARAVEVGDDCELEAIAGEGHFEHLDPSSEAWAATVRWLERQPR